VVFVIVTYIPQETNGMDLPTYPVAGHEIIGRVVEVGNAVTTHKVGDLVGVGCMVDSCQTCSPCKQDLEQFCEMEQHLLITVQISILKANKLTEVIQPQ
jgi:D-arabinose 1-dehydrogenase-like Zn-dependent alcohol dehydrogenase